MGALSCVVSMAVSLGAAWEHPMQLEVALASSASMRMAARGNTCRPLLNKSMYGWIFAWALTSKKGVHGALKPVTVSAFPPWCMGLAVFAKQVLLRKHLADCYKELRPWGNAVDAREVAAATALVILDNTLQHCTCAIMY